MKYSKQKFKKVKKIKASKQKLSAYVQQHIRTRRQKEFILNAEETDKKIKI